MGYTTNAYQPGTVTSIPMASVKTAQTRQAHCWACSPCVQNMGNAMPWSSWTSQAPILILCRRRSEYGFLDTTLEMVVIFTRKATPSVSILELNNQVGSVVLFSDKSRPC